MRDFVDDSCNFSEEEIKNQTPKLIYRKVYGAQYEKGKKLPMAEYEIVCDGTWHMYKKVDSEQKYYREFARACPNRNAKKDLNDIEEQAPTGVKIWPTKLDEVMVKNDCFFVNGKKTNFDSFDELLIKKDWKVIDIPKRTLIGSQRQLQEDLNIATSIFFRLKSEKNLPGRFCKIRNIIELYREYIEIITSEKKETKLEKFVRDFEYCFMFVDNAIPENKSALREICEMIGRRAKKMIFFRLSDEMIKDFGNFVFNRELNGLNYYKLRWWK